MAEFISLLPCVEHPSWQLPHVILNIIWVEAVRYNEMFVLPGSRVSTMRCSGVPATGHLNISLYERFPWSTMRCSGVPATGYLNIPATGHLNIHKNHGTSEHPYEQRSPVEYNEMFLCPQCPLSCSLQ